MLTARKVIAATIAISILALVVSVYSMMRTPDHRGERPDTYGTRASGLRAMYEIVETLGFPVDRSLIPPPATIPENATLVIWNPFPMLVFSEPNFLIRTRSWMERGGRVVLAPEGELTGLAQVMTRTMPGEQKPSYELLGLEGLVLRGYADAADSSSPTPLGPGGGVPADEPELSTEDELDQLLEDLRTSVQIEMERWPVQGSGDFAALAQEVDYLSLPADDLRVMDLTAVKTPDRLEVLDQAGNWHCVVARFPQGDGELIVVSDPRLAINRNVAEADNSVLLVNLLASAGRPVWFEEFYHALTIRGNPFWLLTQSDYRAAIVAIVGILLFWVWRESQLLGPRLEPTPASRRSIAEYVEAMARFVLRSRNSYLYSLQEVREGVLRSVRQELKITRGRADVGEICAVLERRDAERAARLRAAITEADKLLIEGANPSQTATIRAMRGLTACL